MKTKIQDTQCFLFEMLLHSNFINLSWVVAKCSNYNTNGNYPVK